MRKIPALFLTLALCCFADWSVALYAQEPPYNETVPDDNDPEGDGQGDSGFDRYIPESYTKGDQNITISIGTIFPAAFVNNGHVLENKITPPVGGILSLAYNYFIGPNFFLGGEIGFNTAFTLGKNALFIIPIGFRAGWQFVFNRFEIPLYAAIGIAPQKYLDLGYFGMYIKCAASAYYRFLPKWSFGLIADWSWYPQWTMENGKRTPDKDVDAHIFGVILSARYHF